MTRLSGDNLSSIFSLPASSPSSSSSRQDRWDRYVDHRGGPTFDNAPPNSVSNDRRLDPWVDEFAAFLQPAAATPWWNSAWEMGIIDSRAATLWSAYLNFSIRHTCCAMSQPLFTGNSNVFFERANIILFFDQNYCRKSYSKHVAMSGASFFFLVTFWKKNHTKCSKKINQKYSWVQ